MDALALLKKDHQTVEKLFARFEKNPSKAIADKFVRELSIHAAIEVVDFFRGRVALRKLRADSAAAGFPLDRKMAMVVTTDRLLIWRAARHSPRLPVLLGDVPRARITSATFPYVGGGWKVVRVELEDGVRVQFFVDPVSAVAFVDALDGGRAEVAS